MNKLTGETTYNAIYPDEKTRLPWETIAIQRQIQYNELAQRLNQQLGIIEKAPEITIDQAIEQLKALGYIHLPKAYLGTSLQWKAFKTLDGRLETCTCDQDVLNLLESATLQGGPLKDCHFILRYSPAKIDEVETTNLEELLELINKHVPMPAPDQSQRYKIDVMKGALQMGTGIYERTPIEIKVIDESGAAQGLNDKLYKIAFDNV